MSLPSMVFHNILVSSRNLCLDMICRHLCCASYLLGMSWTVIYVPAHTALQTATRPAVKRAQGVLPRTIILASPGWADCRSFLHSTYSQLGKCKLKGSMREAKVLLAFTPGLRALLSACLEDWSR